MSRDAALPARRVIAFTLLAAALIGGAVFLGLGHAHAGGTAAARYLPRLTPVAVIGAGLLDGINPCAFTMLLLLVTALLAVTQVGGAPDSPAVRGRVLLLGSIYVSAVFLTYLALGAGLLSAGGSFTGEHWPSRLAAVTAVGLGLWMLKDALLPSAGPRLEAPHGLTSRVCAVARRGTIPALILSGFLIGLCTVPCSGAIYLAILALLAAQPDRLAAYGYLLLYNALVIVPLLAILMVASSRPLLVRLSRWQRQHRERVRLAIGSSVALLGLLLLAAI